MMSLTLADSAADWDVST